MGLDHGATRQRGGELGLPWRSGALDRRKVAVDDPPAAIPDLNVGQQPVALHASGHHIELVRVGWRKAMGKH